MTRTMGDYTSNIPEHDKELLIPIDQFLDGVNMFMFTDDDGFGYPAKDGKMDKTAKVIPSLKKEIPWDATHIVWYNK